MVHVHEQRLPPVGRGRRRSCRTEEVEVCVAQVGDLGRGARGVDEEDVGGGEGERAERSEAVLEAVSQASEHVLGVEWVSR